MKLVIINDMLWGGGRERRIVQLISGLNRLGVRDITLILLDERIDYPEVYNLNVKVVKILRKNNRDFTVFVKLYRLLKEIGPDLVNPWSYMSVFYTAPICLLKKIPCLGAFVVDSKSPKLFSINWFAMHIGFFLCEKIVSNSLAGHQAYRTPVKKRVIIYNGFDESRLDSLCAAPSKGGVVQIAMIGRLDRQKDYRTYVDALVELKSRGVKFNAYIVGQGEDMEAIKAYALERCDDSLVFMGFIREIDSFIASLDIGVLCTDPYFHAEGISNALLEIMAQGKPVVATNGGGTPEIVTDGNNGFLVPPHDPLTLAERLHQLISDSSLRATLGDNAARTVSSKFSLQKMSSEFLHIYHECL
ncbi:glycosyltransferase family 4 protein [Azonexus sp.]|uniref:glycosyltransferase family 4 protein n=1 Tax=Azonexus sp. TaxID=1872668 RepID=UPI0035B0070E